MRPGGPPTLSSQGAGAKGCGLSPLLAAGSHAEGKEEVTSSTTVTLLSCLCLQLLCSSLLAKLKALLPGHVE